MKEYWLHKDSKKVVTYLEDFHEKWSLWNNSPFRQAWLRNFIAYYSPVINPGSWDTSLIFEGLQGELVRMYTPKARSYIKQLVTIVTKQRLALQAMCLVDGSDVVETVKLANALGEQIIQKESLDTKCQALVEGSLVCGSWFMKAIWNTARGERYSQADNGTLVYKGGVEITTHSVFDTFYDITFAEWDHLPWVEVRTIKNRWDLLAQHPELEREIFALPSVRESRGPNTWFDRSLTDEDIVFVYEFYARPSPSLPKGRMVMYGSGEAVFHDGENIYGTLPIEPLTPETVLGTGLGYPSFSDVAACQEMYDNSLSAIATNQSQFAVQAVAVARGSNVNVQELNGMRLVSFTPQNVPGGGKPEPLQLSQSSPETFKFSGILDKDMQDILGVNGALRGQLPAGVTSGVAIATLSANALEFTEGISKPYRICMEKVLFHAINAYAKFSSLPQTVEIKGTGSKLSRQEFTGDQLKNISGIKIMTANPMMQTISGRLEICQQLFQMPQELWPKYISILEGRPLSDVTKNALSQEDLIQSENELLMQGKLTPALATDDHACHVADHAGLLNDPMVRMNNMAVQTILQHMEQHLQLAQTTDPMLTAMVRTGKMPALAQGMPPPGGANPPPPGGIHHSMPHAPPSAVSPELGAYGAPPTLKHAAQKNNPVAGPTTNTAKPAQDMLGRVSRQDKGI